jgi:hypothetical protein
VGGGGKGGGKCPHPILFYLRTVFFTYNVEEREIKNFR